MFPRVCANFAFRQNRSLSAARYLSVCRNIAHNERYPASASEMKTAIRFNSSMNRSLVIHLTPFRGHDSNFGLERMHERTKRRYGAQFGHLLSLASLLAIIEFYRRKCCVNADQNVQNDEQNRTKEEIKAGAEIADLPTYTAAEVSKHNDANDSTRGVWITYKAGVYDVTTFVAQHPGGDNILLGAGHSIEPFWEVYGQHKTPQVFELLESFRIGNLREADRLKPADLASADKQNMEYIPHGRNSELLIHHEKPFNAETPASWLMRSFHTNNDDFFIRNHLSVPEVDLAEYTLEIEGITIENGRTFTLEDLKTLFPKHSVTSVIQCAGNRRDAFNEIKEVKGISWGIGAIGNAKWSGARLVDVLRFCGADLTNTGIKHVQFEGLDLDATSAPYGASVPADKALNPANEFLLAYEMNDAPIPADHGFPVRLIAPGIVGARNVKWLGRVILADHESHSHWQRNDYKSFAPNLDFASGEQFAAANAIQELPIQSAICSPVAHERVLIRWKPEMDSGSGGAGIPRPVVEVCGYAWSGGGRAVIRVDVTLDGGKTWHEAKLEREQPNKSPHHTYSWTLWKVDLPVDVGRLHQGANLEIACRAFDASYNTQPRETAEIWNFRGLLNNSWHRVAVRVA